MKAAEYFKKLNGDYDKHQLGVVRFSGNDMIDFADNCYLETLQELERMQKELETTKQELENIKKMQIISSENKQKDYTKYMK
jgi:hypothetical protein